MMKWWVMVVVLVGCSARSPGPPPGAGSANATAPAAAEDPVKALVAKADQALADSMKLDYRLPFSNERVDRNPIRMMYFKACRAGDHRACWMTTNVAVRGHQRDAYDDEAEKQVRDHCLAGDVMSCRAAKKPDTLPGDPAHVARSQNCGADTPCDLVAIRRECKAGFPRNCLEITAHDQKAPDIDEISATGEKLTRAGCELGIANECEWLKAFARHDETHNRADLLFAYERICTMWLLDCNMLGMLYLSEPPDVANARDAFERSCQLQNLRDEDVACKDAWRAYTDPRSGVVEPVPGRAKQLRDWVCEKYKVCWD